MKQEHLQKLLYRHCLSAPLISALIIGILLLILYFSIIAIISSATTKTLLEKAQQNTYEIALREAQKIDLHLQSIMDFAQLMQEEQQRFFLNPQVYHLPNGEPEFATADNGVFYKAKDNGGTSLYYSSQTEMTDAAYQKALQSEALDPLLKYVVTYNKNVNAAYFNTYDNMSRYYPFIDNVAEELGPHFIMSDFNFYYEADAQRNPDRTPVWTNAYLDPAGHGWMLSCVVPIYTEDFLQGVTGIDVTLTEFTDDILQLNLPWEGSAFLVNSDGTILAMPEKIEDYLGLHQLQEQAHNDKLVRTIEKPEEFNLLKNERSPAAQQLKPIIVNHIKASDLYLNQQQFLLIQAEISVTGWRLMVLINPEEIYASTYALVRFAQKIGYGAIIFMLFFYLAFFFYLFRKARCVSEKIAHPMTELATLTSNYQKLLHNHTQLAQSQSDIIEIRQLTDNFNQMVVQLQTLFANLEEAKQSLERTVQKRTEQLAQQNHRLAELNRDKNEFLGIVAHDLKNPLGAIQNLAQFIEDSNQDVATSSTKEIHEYADMIQDTAKQMFDLITNLLDVNAIESGNINMENQQINLLPLIEKLVGGYLSRAAAKNIRVSLHSDEADEYVAYVDKNVTHQVLDNIVSNAIKYSALDSNVKIRVYQKTDYIYCEVRDEGEGLSSEEQSSLFKKFKRLSTQPTADEHSTGLGLFITKKLLDAMHGHIWCESQKGHGSCFTVAFPRPI